MKKLRKILACLCALCMTSATYSSMTSVYASEGFPQENVTVSMSCLYAEDDLVDYLAQNDIFVSDRDTVILQKNNGISSLLVKHIVSENNGVKIIEYSSLRAYNQDETGLSSTDVSVTAAPTARQSVPIEFEPNNCDITVTGTATFTMTSTDGYLFTAYCNPTKVAFSYSVNSSNPGDVDIIGVGIYCGGVLCDSDFDPIQDEFGFEINKIKDDPVVGTTYSQTGSLSSYGGSWILISGNIMYGGFYMTFDVVSNGRPDNHTQKINFF